MVLCIYSESLKNAEQAVYSTVISPLSICMNIINETGPALLKALSVFGIFPTMCDFSYPGESTAENILLHNTFISKYFWIIPLG